MRTKYGERDIKGFVGRQTHLSYLPWDVITLN